MEINRNQYCLIGLVLFFLGCAFRTVDTIDLTPEFTQFLAERTRHPLAAVSATTQSLMQSDKPGVKKTLHPPEWLGWSLASIGAVLILHACAMKKPGT